MYLTIGVLTVIVKACKSLEFRSEVAGRFCSNFRSFVLRCAFFVAILVLSACLQLVGSGFFVLILVLSGSSTSWTCIFRGNARTSRCSATILDGSSTGSWTPGGACK